MKKAVIAVAVVLVFIFTLTQKSGAADAGTWAELSDLLGSSDDYYSSPIELLADITSNTFSLLNLGANKTITSNPSKPLSLTFAAPQTGILALSVKKLMFQNLNLLTFSNASASAIKNENLSLITFDTLTVKFLNNIVASGNGGAIYNSG
ncbi:MAG: hypothetical protein LBB93_04290, partial [Elusimicrobiota bacterium]|nr:hypothetical protein [Elusimicrobiota bacterium]